MEVRSKILALFLFLATIAGAQGVTDTCDYLEGGILERQMQTGITGLLRGSGYCVQSTVVNGGLEMVGATLSVVDGDTTGQVLRWNGTTWVPRLIIFPASEVGVDTAYNGLTDRDTAFVLGGPLVEHTTITGQQAYDFYLSNMRTIYMEAQRTSGVAFSSVTMGSTAAAGVDFAHYNEADNQKQAVAAVNYSTGNVVKIQDSASNGTYFQQYDNGGGLFQTDITSSNGADSKTIRVNRDAVFVINLEHLDISNEAAFMMIDTFTGELKYKSPADFAGLYGDDWGSQTVSSTARFSGVGTSGSPLELAQQSATSGQVLKWSGSAWTPGTDASGTTYTAENGTYLDGTILKLGTPLTENTAIDGAGFTLGITDASNITLSATGSFGITSTLSVDEFSSSLSILNGSTESLFSGNGTQSYMSHENNSTGATARVMAENYRKVGLQYYPTGGTPTLEYFLDGGATVPGHYQVGMRYKSSGDTMLVTDATTGEVRRRPLSVTPAQITNGTTGSFLRSGASIPAWETAASLQGSLLLPSGTSGQTLRYGTSWTANSLLYNDGTNIGIGTTSPSEKLSIAGSMYLSDQIWMSSNRGVISVGNIFSNGLPDDFLFRAVGGNLRFGTSAYASMSIMTDGRIGFGDASTSPTYDLQLARSTGTIMAIESQASGSVATPAQTALLFVGGSSSKTAKICGIDRLANVGYGGLSFYVPSNVASSVSSMEERIRIDGTGDANFYCSIAPNGNAGTSGHVYVSGGANTYGSYSSPSAIVLAGNGLQVSGTPTAGQTLRYNSSGAWVANSILYNDGTSVGIGTTSPSGKLNIVTTNTADNLKLDSNSGGVTGVTFLNDNTVKGYFAITRAADQFFTGTTSDDMVFRSESDNIHFGVGAGTPGISIVSNNTGIGTTSPAQKLHVQGTARITGSDGTATGLMGRDADGDISGVGLSVGLEFSGSNIQADLGSGLNVSGNSIAWGGTLTENTTQDFDTYDVFFTNMPASTTEDEALVIDSGTGKLARGQIPITAIRAPGEATYLGDNGGTGETVTWQPEDILVEADPTAGHLTVELNTSMKQGLAYSLFGCCNLTYNITLNSGTMKITGSYGTTSSYVLGAGEHLEVIRMSSNTFYISKK